MIKTKFFNCPDDKDVRGGLRHKAMEVIKSLKRNEPVYNHSLARMRFVNRKLNTSESFFAYSVSEQSQLRLYVTIREHENKVVLNRILFVFAIEDMGVSLNVTKEQFAQKFYASISTEDLIEIFRMKEPSQKRGLYI